MLIESHGSPQRRYEWSHDALWAGLGRQWLYRAWGKDDDLLYIGITWNAFPRLSRHRLKAEWWPLAVRISLQAVEEPEYLVLQVERAAIRTERPRFNKRSAVSG